jgi:hypothetical protein
MGVLTRDLRYLGSIDKKIMPHQGVIKNNQRKKGWWHDSSGIPQGPMFNTQPLELQKYV